MNGESRIGWFKEIVIAALAMITMWALLDQYTLFSTLPTSADQVMQARTANVEKVATGLFAIFAAFVGYYSGRVPAERAAAASQREASAERSLGEERKKQAGQAASLLESVRDRIGGRGEATGADRNTLVAEIDAFLKQVRAL